MQGTQQMLPLVERFFTKKPQSAAPGREQKWTRILRALVHGSLNKFDAEKLGDHCLNTTACELKRDRLIEIDSEWEEVPCMGGTATTRVKRYKVARDPENMRRARELLGLS